MRENAVASAIHNTTIPTISLASALTGVRLPNALALRNRGKASCSIALKQCSFCWWNISGTCARAEASISYSGLVVLGS